MSEKKNKDQDSQAEVYQPSNWLVQALEMAGDATRLCDLHAEPKEVSAAFRKKCRRAAEVALTFARLRKERERVKFVPLSLAGYVQGLAKVAGLSLGPVLEWAGIADLSRPGPRSANAFARLAHRLGLGLRETLAYVRITFAEQLDSAPIPVLVAHRRSGATPRSQLEECEEVLDSLESEYDPKQVALLQRVEAEILAAYHSSESDPA